MIDFRPSTHEVLGIPILEILLDGRMVATIYPEGEKGMKIVSAHFKGVGTDKDFKDEVKFDPGSDPRLPIPSIHITLNPGPFKIEGGKIVKLNHD